MSRKKNRKQNQGSSWEALKAAAISWYASKNPIFQFAVKFAAMMAAFYALLFTSVCEKMLYLNLEMDAWFSSVILNALGQPNHVSGVIISSAQFGMAIRRGCDAVEPTWLFCAAVLAFPVPWARKVPGILIGIILLQALNLVRIVSLYFIGIHLPAFFNTAHLEIWPTAFIIVAILLFVGWIEWSTCQPNSHAIA